MSEVRLIDANALTKIIEREIYYAENPTIHRTLNYVLGAIDNAPTVSDRYDEGFRDGYAQCINNREEKKENNRLFGKAVRNDTSTM